jgi:hypothetical protein
MWFPPMRRLAAESYVEWSTGTERRTWNRIARQRVNAAEQPLRFFDTTKEQP